MIKDLPKLHPDMRNCVNQMDPMLVVALDLEGWDTSDDGSFVSVTLLGVKYDFEDKLQWESYTPKERNYLSIESSGMLPFELQEWINDNIEHLWMYDARFVRTASTDSWSSYELTMAFTFVFEKVSDAVLFRMAWSDLQ